MVDQSLLRLVRAGGNLADQFALHASKAGMFVRRCTEKSLTTELRSLAATLGCRRIVVSIADLALAVAMGEALTVAGVDRIDLDHGTNLDAYFDADTGFTDVMCAIAETGTLVLSSAKHGRGAYLVPPVHVAIVRAGLIVPDMLDLWSPGANADPVPSCLVLISGPSKTADIEGVLVTGVHGPREVHVVIVEPEAPGLSTV